MVSVVKGRQPDEKGKPAKKQKYYFFALAVVSSWGSASITRPGYLQAGYTTRLNVHRLL